MKSKLIHAGELKTWAVVFGTGDEVVEGLKRFVKQHQLGASQITGIGAFSDCVLGFFSFQTRDYSRIWINEQVELLSLLGDVTLDEKGEPKIHVHVVLGKSDGTAHGGHLLEAHVKPTLEAIITESPGHLCRVHDPATGLALIKIDADKCS